MDYIPYHKDREDFELMDTPRAYWFWKFAIQYIQDLKLALDIGCGKGVLVSEFNNKGINTYGIDLRGIYEGDKSKFSYADARNLPFKDGIFDLVCQHYTIEDMISLQGYNTKQIQEVNKEIHRVLRSGGCFLSMPPRPIYYGYDVIEWGPDMSILRKNSDEVII